MPAKNNIAGTVQRRWSMSARDIDRFWSYVERTDSESDCWLWKGAKDRSGYGKMYWLGSVQRATRISLEIWTEREMPVGMYACHHCDNPSCVNPLHLFCDTARGNTRDMVAKGRSSVGARNGNAVLTDAKVIEIRSTYVPRSPEFGSQALAKKFGVTARHIRKVAGGAEWRHLSVSNGEAGSQC